MLKLLFMLAKRRTEYYHWWRRQSCRHRPSLSCGICHRGRWVRSGSSRHLSRQCRVYGKGRAEVRMRGGTGRDGTGGCGGCRQRRRALRGRIPMRHCGGTSSTGGPRWSFTNGVPTLLMLALTRSARGRPRRLLASRAQHRVLRVCS